MAKQTALELALEYVKNLPGYDERRRAAPHPNQPGFIVRATSRGIRVEKLRRYSPF